MESPIYADNSERDSRSNVEKIVITDRCKSGLDDGLVWPDPSHDHCSKKQVHDVHADNVMSITDRMDTRQEFGCHENLEGNKTYASLKEQNSTHRNDNGMGMVRERRENNDGKKVELDTNMEDVITIHPQVSRSNQCLQCNDENRAAEISEDEYRGMILTNRREELLGHNLSYALDNSPSGINGSERSRNDSLEWQQSYYHDRYPINKYQHGYEKGDPVECSCIDYFSCRKYCPLLGEHGIIKYGGYHAMEINPAIRCSLQDNINTSFGHCIDVLTGGVYGGHNSMYGMSSVGFCGGTVGVPVPLLPAGTCLSRPRGA